MWARWSPHPALGQRPPCRSARQRARAPGAHHEGMAADPGLAPTHVAYLRGGRWSATQTALAMLAARGLLVAGPPGRIRRTGVPPPASEVLERALFNDLYATRGA